VGVQPLEDVRGNCLVAHPHRAPKKKELIGEFKNPGRQWRPTGDPVLVRTKDFKDKDLGKVNPYRR
jgi:hypothetical protein